jgi:hypothetical protein
LFCWQGLALTRVPKIKYLIIIGGARFRGAHTIAEKPYASKIKIPSLHFLGNFSLFCAQQTLAIAMLVAC